jgi:hypothetical protein
MEIFNEELAVKRNGSRRDFFATDVTDSLAKVAVTVPSAMNEKELK